MSGRTIRTSSDAVHETSRTDWGHLKALGDEAIDEAIASDQDAYPLEKNMLGRAGSAYCYEICEENDGRYRWRLVAANGQILASSHRVFASRSAAEKAIAGVRDALLGGRLLAA